MESGDAMAPRPALRGFTLIELLVVVAIAGVLAVLALPSMRDLVVANRMKTLSLDLYSSLSLARSEAVKRNSSTVKVMAASGGWQNGWTVCYDADNNNACTDAGDEILQVQDAIDSSITLAESGGAVRVTYSRDGRVATTVAFRITGATNSVTVPMRCVELDVSGRARTKVDTNHTDSDGCN